MKITLDVDKLVQQGHITAEEAERLKALAAQETGGLAFNILIGFGVIAVAGGLVALVPSPPIALGLGGLMAVCGAMLSQQRREQWGLLGAMLLLVGSLTAGASILALTEGSLTGFLTVAALYLVGSVLAQSGLLAALAALALTPVAGASTGYMHASYSLGIEQPTLTIGLFSLLGIGAYGLSKTVALDYARLAIIFSRTCLFVVNFGFWIGSLWGDTPFKPGSGWSSATQAIPDWVFGIAWAMGLLATGVWAARENKRFVVNLVATFGAIHFYTQWFERLGPSPGSVVLAGLLALAMAMALFRYNRRKKSSGSAD
jgi:hypothetical protein